MQDCRLRFYGYGSYAGFLQGRQSGNECGPRFPPPPPAVVPTVVLEQKDVTPGSIKFEITPSHAGAVAYVVLEATQEIPTVEEILADGEKVSASEATLHTALDLKEGAAYIIAAGARGSEETEYAYSKVETLEVTTGTYDAPTLVLELKEALQTKLTFTITTTNAVEAAYLFVRNEEALEPEIPTVEYIFANGTKAAVNEEDSITLNNLVYEAKYTVFAAARGMSEGSFTEVKKLEAETTNWSEEYEATRMQFGYFGKSIYGTENGEFVIQMDNVIWGPATSEGPGYEMSILCFSDYFENPADARIAPGVYTVDQNNPRTKFSINYGKYSWWGRYDDTGQPGSNGNLQAGTLTVSEPVNGEYEITADFKIYAGTYLKMTWKGPITWTDETPVVPTDQIFDATYAEGSYSGKTIYSSHPDSDLWNITLRDKADNPQKNLHMEIYTDPAVDPFNPAMPDCELICKGGGNTDPGTFAPGKTDYYGTSGTDIKVVEKDGATYPYYCNGGKIKITKSGGNYTIAYDLETSDNQKIKGTYTGPVAFENKWDPWVTELDVNADRIVDAAYVKNGSVGQYRITLTDCELDGNDIPIGKTIGSVVSLDLIYEYAVEEDGNYIIPSGTYTKNGNQKYNTNGTRFVMYTALGSRSMKVYDGTIEVSRTSRIYTIKVECRDSQVTTLKCSYTGEIPIPVD